MSAPEESTGAEEEDAIANEKREEKEEKDSAQ